MPKNISSSIKEIALNTYVSSATVLRLINVNARVKDETVQTIQAIKPLGCLFNGIGKRLQVPIAGSRLISLPIQHIQNPYCVTIIWRIEKYADSISDDITINDFVDLYGAKSLNPVLTPVKQIEYETGQQEAELSYKKPSNTSGPAMVKPRLILKKLCASLYF